VNSVVRRVRRQLTHLNLAHRAIAYSINVTRSAAVDERRSILRWAGTAARMPDCRALEVHFLAVTEGIAALRAASAGRVKVMVVTSLENLATDVALAVSTLHAEGLLVVFLAVGLAVFAHVLATQDGAANQTSSKNEKVLS
jgi:hypothetical protein